LHNPLIEHLHSFAPHLSLAQNIKLSDDYVFEAPYIGFFKLAHLKRDQGSEALILYYARHPKDFDGKLAGNTSPPNTNPIYPIWVEEITANQKLKWDPADSREQYDTTWVLSKILDFIHRAPQVLLPEVNLHCYGKNEAGQPCYRYYFGEYTRCADSDTSRFSRIMVSTNTTRSSSPLGSNEPLVHEARSGIWSQFRSAAHKTMQWKLSDQSALGVRHEENDNDQRDIRIRRHFIAEEIVPTIMSDFLNRVKSILKHRINPTLYSEKRHVAFVRLHEKLRKKVEEAHEYFVHEKQSAFIQMGAMILHASIDGMLSLVLMKIIETLAELRSHDNHPGLPASMRLVKNCKHLLCEVDSEVQGLFLHIDHPNTLREMCKASWLKPRRHLLSTACLSHSAHQPSDYGFKTWLASHFFMSVGALREYLGPNGSYVSPHDENIKVVHVNVPNGLQLYRVHNYLYAYYHESKVKLVDNEPGLHTSALPEGAERYFKKGLAVRVDLKQPENAIFEAVSFQDMARVINQACGGQGDQRVLTITSAQEYIPPTASHPKAICVVARDRHDLRVA